MGISERDFSPAAAAAFLRSTSQATGMQQTTWSPPGATQTSVLKEESGSSPSRSAMRTPTPRETSVSSNSWTS